MFDDCDDWDDCDERDAGGGAGGATFLGDGAMKSERESLCSCGLSTGAELFTAGAPIWRWSGLVALLLGVL